ncbi:MAG: 3-phosphoshikimate 1-carboxyvinyltransferase [Calditrichaeota bacterium]|nr:MAG: 3-phosphoshikimate 1-carboxyvinyltransferase [Calditrichota bacterium]
MADLTWTPGNSMRGEIKLPGDKSISHRALMLGAIADGVCRITGISTAEDVNSTAACLRKLGIKIDRRGHKVAVHGQGAGGLAPAKTVLDAGNSGTTIRLLAGILAAQPFTSTITGDESLRSRPMRRIIEPLEQMGAQIESTDNRAPLTLRGNVLHAIDFASPVASAQVKSCVLLAGLFAKGVTRVTEPFHSRDHTERMLREMGVSVHTSAAMSAVKGPAGVRPCDIDIPSDISAAAFFMTAAALMPNSEVVLNNVGVNPSRTGIIDALTAMGAQLRLDEVVELNHEPRARIIARSSKLKAVTLGGAMIPRIIDEIPILAIAATQAEGTTTIKDAGELRVKESDRIAAIADNLKRMGASVRELKDGLAITGPTPLKGAEIESHHDHRIAMAFSIAAQIASGETLIKNIDCINISFPGFIETLQMVQSD